MHRNPTRMIVASLAIIATGLLAGCSSKSDDKAADTTVAAAQDATDTTAYVPGANGEGEVSALPCPAADGSSPATKEFPAEPEMCIDPAKTYVATIETNKGTMVFTLDPAKAPRTVNSFVYLARYHYFDGISFHRVVPNFVLQGGDPTGTGTGGPGYEFADELPQAGEYRYGDLAMANAGPNTNGSQFFVISGADGAALPPNYSLFGHLKDGKATIDAIGALATGDGPPSEPVTMTKVTITES